MDFKDYFPSTESLNDMFEYDEERGVITSYLSDEDISEYCSETNDRYIDLVEGRFRVADLAWVMMGRSIPDGDYICSLNLKGVPKYAKQNLAPASFTLVSKEKEILSGKGGKGYYFEKHRQMWKVQISVSGKRISGGYFATEQEAIFKVEQLRNQIAQDKVLNKSNSRDLPKYIYNSGFKYKVLIPKNGENEYLGTFNTLSEAVIFRDRYLEEENKDVH